MNLYDDHEFLLCAMNAGLIRDEVRGGRCVIGWMLSVFPGRLRVRRMWNARRVSILAP